MTLTTRTALAGSALVICALALVSSAYAAGLKSNELPLTRHGTQRPSSNHLLHYVNIIGPTDDRDAITVLGPKLGLTPDEINYLRTVTGYVMCPGTKYHNRAISSGALVGSNEWVLTAAHTFIDEQGRRREPLSDCWFQNQTVPWTKSPLRFEESTFKFGTEFPYRSIEDQAGDWAIVRLEAPLNGSAPLPISTIDVRDGDPVFNVFAHAAGMMRHVPMTEPGIEACQVRKKYRHGTMFDIDCDVSGGQSGSMVLSRDVGELAVVGIAITSGKPEQDFTPYDGTNSFSYVVGIDKDFVDRTIKNLNECAASDLHDSRCFHSQQ